MKIVNNVVATSRTPNLGEVYYKNKKSGDYYLLAKTQDSASGQLYNLINLATGLRQFKVNRTLSNIKEFLNGNSKFELVKGSTITIS